MMCTSIKFLCVTISVMNDDQGCNVVSDHGNPWIETPALDKMYSSSIHFDCFQSCGVFEVGTFKVAKKAKKKKAKK